MSFELQGCSETPLIGFETLCAFMRKLYEHSNNRYSLAVQIKNNKAQTIKGFYLITKISAKKYIRHMKVPLKFALYSTCQQFCHTELFKCSSQAQKLLFVM